MDTLKEVNGWRWKSSREKVKPVGKKGLKIIFGEFFQKGFGNLGWGLGRSKWGKGGLFLGGEKFGKNSRWGPLWEKGPPFGRAPKKPPFVGDRGSLSHFGGGVPQKLFGKNFGAKVSEKPGWLEKHLVCATQTPGSCGVKKKGAPRGPPHSKGRPL